MRSVTLRKKMHTAMYTAHQLTFRSKGQWLASSCSTLVDGFSMNISLRWYSCTTTHRCTQNHSPSTSGTDTPFQVFVCFNTNNTKYFISLLQQIWVALPQATAATRAVLPIPTSASVCSVSVCLGHGVAASPGNWEHAGRC